MSKLNELIEAGKALQVRLTNEGREALKQHFAAFFEANPKIEAVQWRQYTPWFNDGDACTFSVHEIDRADVGEDLQDTWDLRETPEGIAIEALSDSLQQCQDILEIAFGDHVSITATREGFDVEEYEHD